MNRRRLLVADDEESVLTLVAATFQGLERFELRAARDGEEALRICRNDMPDVVFLDVRMPRLDGLQVCTTLKGDPETCHIRVIMLTAMAQKQDMDAGIQAGADDYLIKPFSPSNLLRMAERYSGIEEIE